MLVSFLSQFLIFYTVSQIMGGGTNENLSLQEYLKGNTVSNESGVCHCLPIFKILGLGGGVGNAGLSLATEE